MKVSRQNAILKIIEQYDIETQEELAKRLYEHGHQVTQATISRDIKELHLIKTQTENNTYKYTVKETSKVINTEKLLRVFKETVLDIKSTGNLIVVSTLSGSAAAAAEVIDNMEIEGIVGSIAGDNTIFIAVKASETQSVLQTLKQVTANK